LLIGVGFKLASPREFGRMAKIGPEQLLVFSITIIVTLATDLLVGIGVGIIVKLITQSILGVPLKSTFKAKIEKESNKLTIYGAAVFSNWLGIQKEIASFNSDSKLILDFSKCNLIDHTVMDNLHHLHAEFHHAGGDLVIQGVNEMEYTSKSEHAMSTRKRNKNDRFDEVGNKLNK